MTDVIVAHALHVLAVVIWIGGLSMVTTVVLPAIRHRELGENPWRAFQSAERRFVWQARAAVIVVGLTGLYMTGQLHLWDRFRSAGFWWMHAMVCVWLLFVLLLFVIEPFILHRHLGKWAEAQPEATLAWLHRAHWVLLGLSLVTVCGAVAGSQGWAGF